MKQRFTIWLTPQEIQWLTQKADSTKKTTSVIISELLDKATITGSVPDPTVAALEKIQRQLSDIHTHVVPKQNTKPAPTPHKPSHPVAAALYAKAMKPDEQLVDIDFLERGI